MGYRAAFDYGRMAREAARERDTLRGLLEKRKRQPPLNRDEELRWKQENSMLYAMYLEQRCQAGILAGRAQARAREGAAAQGRCLGKEAGKAHDGWQEEAASA